MSRIMDDFIKLADQFRDDGVVCIKGALDEAWMATAFEAYQWSVANPGGNVIRFKGTSRHPACSIRIKVISLAFQLTESCLKPLR